ncbi:MAG: hypothetical protein ACP5NC_00660 [Nitrososphaeria archaeon]
MVKIVRADRESLFEIDGYVIDMDGLYSSHYGNAVRLFQKEPQDTIKELFDLFIDTPNVIVFSYDTLIILLIEMYGRKGYKIRANNLLRAMRILECATGKSITLIRFRDRFKNDPQDTALADTPCPV